MIVIVMINEVYGSKYIRKVKSKNQKAQEYATP